MKAKYDNKDLLNKLVEFYNAFGRIPKSRELTNENGMPNVATYRNRFGSLREAFVAANLPITGFRIRPKFYSDIELLYLLNRFEQANKRLPNYSDLNKTEGASSYPHVRTYEKRFGSFSNALLLAQVLKEIEQGKELDDFATRVKEFVAANKSVDISLSSYSDEIKLTFLEIEHLILTLDSVYECDICSSVLKKLKRKRKEYL